jgi:hypothetical protein
MKIVRQLSEANKKAIAGRQHFKCANKPGSNIEKLDGYECPLWKLPGENRGAFDESPYDIDHIREHSITGDDSDENLQALCRMCHGVKTRRFMMEGRNKNNKILVEEDKINKLLEEFETIKKMNAILQDENNLINSKNATLISNITINNSPVITDNSIVTINNSPVITDNSIVTINNPPVITDNSIVTHKKKIHQCPICLKTFCRNYILQAHIKDRCKGPNAKKTQCDYCLHVFHNPTNLKIHSENGCKKKILNNNINMDLVDNKNGEENEENEENEDGDDSNDSDDSDANDANENIDVKELLKKLKTLEEENEKLKSQKDPSITCTNKSNKNITINDIQGIANNTQNIILVEFGKEKINKVLTHKEKIKIFETGGDSVTELIKQIHFNEKIPQYNNCYISNRRDNIAIVYDGKGWVAMDVAKVVQTLIDNGKCYLETEYNESKKRYDTTENNTDKNKILSEKAITQFSEYLDKKDNKELKKRYNKETKLMMYNNRNVAIKHKKCINNK